MKKLLSEAQLKQRREANKKSPKTGRPKGAEIEGENITIKIPFDLLEQLPKQPRARNNAIREAVKEFVARQKSR